jgi:hypothetical protein
LPLWLLYIKKPWGLINHPWLFIPILGMALWVTLFKIKIKEVEVRKAIHGSSFDKDSKPIDVQLSREF